MFANLDSYNALMHAIMERRGVDRDGALRLIRDYRATNGGAAREAMEALAKESRPTYEELEREVARLQGVLIRVTADLRELLAENDQLRGVTPRSVAAQAIVERTGL